MIRSMTGFARAQGENDGRAWAWEVKSVNGRGLEVRLRLPNGFDRLEPECRKIASKHLSRGNINASLSLGSNKREADFIVNEANLSAAIEAIRSVEDRLECEKPRPEGILALKGVIQHEPVDEDEATRKQLSDVLLQGFDTAISNLNEARRAEGVSIGSALRDRLNSLQDLYGEARRAANDAVPAFKTRLQTQLSDLLNGTGLTEQRIAEEASILAVKADVREELDRLAAHLSAADSLLLSTEPIGRRFDFLVQEFNREANTLCAKAPDLALKEIGLSLKTVIDQIREQIQNIE